MDYNDYARKHYKLAYTLERLLVRALDEKSERILSQQNTDAIDDTILLIQSDRAKIPHRYREAALRNYFDKNELQDDYQAFNWLAKHTWNLGKQRQSTLLEKYMRAYIAAKRGNV